MHPVRFFLFVALFASGLSANFELLSDGPRPEWVEVRTVEEAEQVRTQWIAVSTTSETAEVLQKLLSKRSRPLGIKFVQPNAVDSTCCNMIAEFVSLSWLDLTNQYRLTDLDIRVIAKLPSLAKLSLAGCCKLTDETLTVLQTLSKLETLSLEATGAFVIASDSKLLPRFTSDGLKAFIAASKVTGVDLSRLTQVDEEVLRLVLGSPHIRSVAVRDCSLLAHGLTEAKIAVSKQLTRLDVSFTSAVDAPKNTNDLELILSAASGVTVVALRRWNLSISAYRALSEAKGLQQLDISSCSLPAGERDDAVFLTRLSELRVSWVTDSGTGMLCNTEEGAGRIVMEAIAYNARLNVLAVQGWTLGERFCKTVAKLVHLSALHLAKVVLVDGVRLSCFGVLTSLKVLDLNDALISTDEFVYELNAELEVLRLGVDLERQESYLSAAALRAIAQMDGLIELDISGCQKCEQETLTSLIKLPRLRSLSIAGIESLSEVHLPALANARLETFNASGMRTSTGSLIVNRLSTDGIVRLARETTIRNLTLFNVPMLTNEAITKMKEARRGIHICP